MRDVNRQLLNSLDAGDVEQWLRVGVAAAHGSAQHCNELRCARQITRFLRSNYYGTAAVDAELLTAPEGQHKLGLGTVPTYGLTLHNYRFKSAVTGLTYNLCTSAGHCTRSCVVGNGNGQYATVQRGWSWRTDLLLNFPWAFFIKLGWELERAVLKHGAILMRPNVNSDLTWERIAPSLVDGSLFGGITFYGYTKHQYVLYETPRADRPLGQWYKGDGWLTPHYRVAFSVNERCTFGNADMLLDGFLTRGGSVACVTDRYYTSRTRQPIQQWAWHHAVVDADLTDEWIFKQNVIGDLAFKPRTKTLRAWGYSDATAFVHKVYADTPVVLGVKGGRELVTA